MIDANGWNHSMIDAPKEERIELWHKDGFHASDCYWSNAVKRHLGRIETGWTDHGHIYPEGDFVAWRRKPLPPIFPRDQPSAILTDTQLVLLKIINIETFCDLETDLDFGRDEIFARIEQSRIKRSSPVSETQRLVEFDDLCALLCHPSPEISLVIFNLIITRYRVQGDIVLLPHFLKLRNRLKSLHNANIATFDYYTKILTKRYYRK